MSSDDQFTSIQWDRDELGPNKETKVNKQETITEDDEHHNNDNEDKDNDTTKLNEPENIQEDDETKDDNEPTDSLILSKTGDENISNIESQNEGDHIVGEPDVNQEPSSDSQTEAYEINVVVTSPLRDLDSSSKPYISYLLTTATNHPSVMKLSTVKKEQGKDVVEITARRRYGDFRFLFDCLSNDHPEVMMPPLPSKLNFKYLTGDTFSTEFVHKRLHSLDRFVRFITCHKVLSQLSIFHLFVSDSADWSTFQKNLKISKVGVQESDADKGNSSMTSNVVNKVVNEDLLTETIMNFLTPSKHKRETNKEILEISDKLKKLYENLIKLDKIFTKLNKKNHDLSVDYEQFLQQIMKLSVIQNSLDETNEPTTPEINEQKQFATNFKVFASSLSYFLDNWSNLHKYIDESFLVSLKDCAKYIISLTNLIELQHNKKIDLQVLQDYLNKAKSELQGLGGSHNAPPNPIITHNNGGIVNNTTQLIRDTLSTSATPNIGSSVTESKVTKLQNRITELENEISVQSQLVLDLTNKIINEEYPNWDKFNKIELKESLLGLCNEEISFYKGLVDNWSDIELKLLKRLDELK